MVETEKQKNIRELMYFITKVAEHNSAKDEYAELAYALDKCFGDKIVIELKQNDNIELLTSSGAKTQVVVTDNGDGTGTFSSIECALFNNENFVGAAKIFTVPEETFEFTDGSEEFVYVNYNNGDPIYLMSDSMDDINGSGSILIAKCWRTDIKLHSFDTDKHALGLSNKIEKCEIDTETYKRWSNGGLIISESTTPNPRTVIVSESRVYAGVTPIEVAAFNSSSNNLYEAVSTVDGWIFTKVSVYQNTSYNPSNSGKTTATDTYYLVVWFYRTIGDDRDVIYTLSDVEYETELAAESAAERTDLPMVIKGHAMLIGRSIILKSAANGDTKSAFDVVFTGASTINHNDTKSIQGGVAGEYNHLTNAEKASLSNIHTQNTDTKLDEGGTNEVTAAQAKTAYTNNHTHSNKSVLDATEESFTTALKGDYNDAVSWISTNGANSHTHSNKSVLDAIQQAFTTVLKNAYDGAVTWISTNGSNLINHLSNTTNPHQTTHANLSGTLNGDGDYHLSQADYTNKITNRRFATTANVTAGNYSGFEADGTYKANGTATYYKDINFPIIIRTSGGNIPAITTINGNLTAVAFAVNDYAVLEAQELVHEWKEGSDIVFHIHLVTNGTNAADRFVKYEIEYFYVNFNAAIPVSNTIVSSEITIPANTPTKTHLIANIATITPTGLTIGSQLIARLRRIASTGTAPAANPWILACQLHIECDTLGSRAITTK